MNDKKEPNSAADGAPGAAGPQTWPPPPSAWMPPPPGQPFAFWPAEVWPPLNKAAAPSRVLGAAVAAGLVAALTLRLDVPGIGFLLTGLAVLAAALGTTKRWPGATQAAAALATACLLTVGAVRAAEWLFAVCFLVAAMTGTLAMVGGRSWPGMVLGVFAMPFVQLRALLWSARGFGRLAAAKGSLVGRAAGVGVITVVLVLAFGALFYSADRAFARIVSAALPELSIENVIGNTFLLAVVTGLTLSAACLAHLPPRFDNAGSAERRPLRTWEWAVPLGVLNVLFGVFVALQLTVLFGKREQQLVGGDFAAYAREGFWQLLAVTALTLLVIAAANAKAGRATRADRLMVRVLLGGLSSFTLVIVASALSRMMSYEEEFGFTRLRLFVHVVEVWLGVVFVLVLIAGVRLRGRWLPRTIVGTGVLALLTLAAINPDDYIARRNVDRYLAQETRAKADLAYLGGLSVDAVPQLQRLPDPQRSCVLREVAMRVDGVTERWFTVNAGRAAAAKSLEDKPIDAAATCPLDAQRPPD